MHAGASALAQYLGTDFSTLALADYPAAATPSSTGRTEAIDVIGKVARPAGLEPTTFRSAT